MQANKLLNFLFFTLVLAFFSCKGDSSTANKSANEEIKEKKSYVLTPFSRSTEYNNAELSDMKYSDGVFDFKVGGEGYKLGMQTPDAIQKMCANSGKGQHIHLIVDDKPYAAKYTSTFEHDLSDGKHYLLAFLSRSYHESIKSPSAHIVQKVNVVDKSIVDHKAIDGKMLFYSRPKGTYVGTDTKKVMLDFYLVNEDLSNNKVIATINGEKYNLDKWQPYYIEGLPMGENTIELSLVDNNGALLDLPLNPVSRTFTLKEDPADKK